MPYGTPVARDKAGRRSKADFAACAVAALEGSWTDPGAGGATREGLEEKGSSNEERAGFYAD